MTKEALEKEAYQYDADHLRDNGTRWYHNVTVREAYLAGAVPREKRIAELEKENKELKTLIKSEHKIEARKNNSLISQITEVKELLARWLRLYKTNTVKGIITDTEQFLSDELRRRRNTDVGDKEKSK